MKITLKETPKLYTMDTHRVVPPEETLKTGGEAPARTSASRGSRRYRASTGSAYPSIPPYARPRQKGAISVYAGKGATPVEARVSVMMESIERYSSEFQKPPIRRRS